MNNTKGILILIYVIIVTYLCLYMFWDTCQMRKRRNAWPYDPKSENKSNLGSEDLIIQKDGTGEPWPGNEPEGKQE